MSALDQTTFIELQPGFVVQRAEIVSVLLETSHYFVKLRMHQPHEGIALDLADGERLLEFLDPVHLKH